MSSVSSAIQSSAATGPAAASSSSATSSTGGIANESTFLQLLVQQLKNQDPLNPADSTQFVTQLAQFSSLEQLENINTNVGNIETVVNPAAAAGTSSTGSSTGSSSGSSSGTSGSSGTSNANSVSNGVNNSDFSSLLG